ncbi:unnamed protein product, partial [Rotaria sp. Silwood2]
MGPAKTTVHRKAQCKCCLWCLNVAKLSMMYSHITHQCDEVVNYDPSAHKEIIMKMCELEQKLSPGRNSKRITE